MGMRLLLKKQINQVNANARKQEIDEGKKLARRIDGLRETLSDEESSLEKFRRETLKAITAEIAPLEEKKGQLEKRVDELKRQREELMQPLTAEWEMVEKAKKDVIRTQEKATEKLTDAAHDRAEAKQLFLQASDADLRAKTCEEDAQKRLENAIIHTREANELKEEAETIKREADKREQEALANIAEEHRKMKMRELALIENEKQVVNDRKELEVEKLQVADQRATLERALKRNK